LGNFKANENEILTALVSDCVNYGFTEREALSYIKVRLGGKEISAETYYRRKKQVDSGEYAQTWLNYFTKVGFVVKHKEIIDVVEMVQKDTIRDYLIEQSKPSELKNKNEIANYRYEIRENAKLLQELSLGTPIIAQIKAKINNINNNIVNNQNNVEVLQSG
jgi:hypothetical protein